MQMAFDSIFLIIKFVLSLCNIFPAAPETLISAEFPTADGLSDMAAALLQHAAGARGDSTVRPVSK